MTVITTEEAAAQAAASLYHLPPGHFSGDKTHAPCTCVQCQMIHMVRTVYVAGWLAGAKHETTIGVEWSHDIAAILDVREGETVRAAATRVVKDRNDMAAEATHDLRLIKRMRQEVAAVVESIPVACRVRVCEGGGEEDIIKSLAVSVAKLTDVALRYENHINAMATHSDEGNPALAALLRLARFRGACAECYHKHPKHDVRCDLGATLKASGITIEEQGA